jgi:hypothetical protein
MGVYVRQKGRREMAVEPTTSPRIHATAALPRTHLAGNSLQHCACTAVALVLEGVSAWGARGHKTVRDWNLQGYKRKGGEGEDGGPGCGLRCVGHGEGASRTLHWLACSQVARGHTEGSVAGLGAAKRFPLTHSPCLTSMTASADTWRLVAVNRRASSFFFAELLNDRPMTGSHSTAASSLQYVRR